MKTLALIGPVDKRVISYPLIKVLSFLGKTLVITDDSTYRRFAENYEQRFQVGTVDFIVEPLVTEKNYEEVEKNPVPYDFVVYITTNELPPKYDHVVHCRGIDKGFGTKPIVDQLDNEPQDKVSTVYITYSKIEDKTLHHVEPSKNALAYCAECEDKKEFTDIKEPTMASNIYTFFEKELNIDKSTISGLLKRKG